MERSITEDPSEVGDIVITESEGKDLLGAVAVSVLSMLYSEDRQWVVAGSTDKESARAKLDAHRRALTKDAIRKRLQWLVSDAQTVVTSGGPARAWLNRVNEVLISEQLLFRRA